MAKTESIIQTGKVCQLQCKPGDMGLQLKWVKLAGGSTSGVGPALPWTVHAALNVCAVFDSSTLARKGFHSGMVHGKNVN